MTSRRRRKPRQSEARIRRREGWQFLAMGVVMVLVGISWLAYVVGSIWAGGFDAPPKGSPRDAPPVFVYASDDPIEFYGSMAFLAAMTLLMLVIGVGIMRQAISESRGGNGEQTFGARLRRRRR